MINDIFHIILITSVFITCSNLVDLIKFLTF